MFLYEHHCSTHLLHWEKLKFELENFVLCPVKQKNIIQKYRTDLEKQRVILLPSNEHI